MTTATRILGALTGILVLAAIWTPKHTEFALTALFVGLAFAAIAGRETGKGPIVEHYYASAPDYDEVDR